MKKDISIGNKIISNFIQARDNDNELAILKQRSLCVEYFDYLVLDKVKKYKKFANYEDLLQEGRMALMSSLLTYNPEKGDFEWWAKQYIKTKVSREANRHSTIKIPLKKTKDMKPAKVSTMPLIIDQSESADNLVVNNQTKYIIQKAIESLPKKQKKYLKTYLETEQSIDKLCKKTKTKKKDCSIIIEKATENLRKKLETFYFEEYVR